MANAAHGLKIRYGLEQNPSDYLVQRWAQLTRELERQGYKTEDAGSLAAKRTFPDYQTKIYASEADTLVALLQAAEGRK